MLSVLLKRKFEMCRNSRKLLSLQIVLDSKVINLNSLLTSKMGFAAIKYWINCKNFNLIITLNVYCIKES
jgi:hypothetical protein